MYEEPEAEDFYAQDIEDATQEEFIESRIYELQKYKEETITVSKLWYEHLVSCLANQKYIHEMSPKDRDLNQQIIDYAYADSTALLNDDANHVWLSPVPPQ